MNCALCSITFRLQFAAIETTDIKTKLISVHKIKVVDFILWHRIYQIRHRQYSANNTVLLPRLSKYRASTVAAYNQQDAKFLNLFFFCKTPYMFQTGFPSFIRTSKLHIQRQVFVRQILLPDASLAG
jgi:hypothetical protein